MEDRQHITGMRFPAVSHTVGQEEAEAYAAATNDDNPAYRQGAVAPPMFAVCLQMPPLMQALMEPKVIGDPKRFSRLLHGEQDMRWHGALYIGRAYTTEASILRVTQKTSGEVIELRLETKDDAGKLVVDTVSAMFIRSEQKGAGGPAKTEEPARAHAFSVREHVAPDQSIRYANASGDHNPIHTDPAVAHKAGLPGLILHGLCTMAFCQKAVVNQLCHGDPAGLQRLKVRFAKPVLMEQTLTISAHGIEPHTFAIDARVDGVAVLADAVAEIA